MAVITEIFARTVNVCEGDTIIRFLNDYSGWDVVLFPGNGQQSFEREIDATSSLRVTNFASNGGQTARERVDKITAGGTINVSRFFDGANKEGVDQMLSSRFVQIWTGPIPFTEPFDVGGVKQKPDYWLDCQLSLNRYEQRNKVNMIFISIKIILPKRFTNEQ